MTAGWCATDPEVTVRGSASEDRRVAEGDTGEAQVPACSTQCADGRTAGREKEGS